MNETIRLYTNISETGHNKQLDIVKSLQSVQEKILRMKKWLKSYKGTLTVRTNVSLSPDVFEIILKTSCYPTTLSFSLTQKVYGEIIRERLNPDYPLKVLDYIFKLARNEYNRIGERYNKVSRLNIGRSRTLRLR